MQIPSQAHSRSRTWLESWASDKTMHREAKQLDMKDLATLLVQLRKTGAIILVNPWGAVKWCLLLGFSLMCILALALVCDT